MTSEGFTRRGVLGSAGVVALGVGWVGSGPLSLARAQAEPVAIDRTVGELVVLPPDDGAVVSGTSTLDPGTDFGVRLRGQGDAPFLLSSDAVVARDGTWDAEFDLSNRAEGEEVIVEVVFDGETVAEAPGVIGRLTGFVLFEDQDADADGSVVVVTEAFLGVGGFVAIHEGGPTGPVLGVSEYLTGGTEYADVEVVLDPPVTGETVLVAASHVDSDGDREFGFTGESFPDPILEEDGVRVFDRAVVTGPPTPEPTEPPTELPTVSPTEPPPIPPDTPTRTRTPTVTGTPNGPSTPPGLDLAVGGGGGFAGLWILTKLSSRLRGGGGRSSSGGDGGGENRKKREGNRPPTARMVHYPKTPEPGRPVLFDGGMSFDPDSGDRIDRYEWTIGDVTSTGRRVVHLFGGTGEVDVELAVTDSHGATGRRTETVEVESHEGRLELASVHPETPGEGPADLHHESVTFSNTGDAPLDLEGWTVHDAAAEERTVAEGEHTFTFPEDASLAPGETLTVHTGAAPETDGSEESPEGHHIYWGERRPIWDDDTDAVVVRDGEGNPVLATQYGRTDEGTYELEGLEEAGLEEWFPTVEFEVPGTTPLPNVSTDRRIEGGAISNAVDFVAGALFLRGTRKFARNWALITGFLLLSLLTWGVSTATGFLDPSVQAIGPVLLVVGAVLVTVVGALVALVQRVITFLVRLVTSQPET